MDAIKNIIQVIILMLVGCCVVIGSVCVCIVIGEIMIRSLQFAMDLSPLPNIFTVILCCGIFAYMGDKFIKIF